MKKNTAQKASENFVVEGHYVTKVTKIIKISVQVACSVLVNTKNEKKTQQQETKYLHISDLVVLYG